VKDYKYSLNIMKQELNSKWICPEVKYAFKSSIEALEKQIPQQVIKTEQIKSRCPVCGISSDWHYCPNCGQRLKY